MSRDGSQVSQPRGSGEGGSGQDVTLCLLNVPVLPASSLWQLLLVVFSARGHPPLPQGHTVVPCVQQGGPGEMANEDVGSYSRCLGVVCLHQGVEVRGSEGSSSQDPAEPPLSLTNRENLGQKTEPQFTQLLAGEGQDKAQLHPPTP